MIDAIHNRFGMQVNQSPAPPLPSASEVTHAISSVAEQKNGYLAWALYTALRQGGVQMPQRDVAKLAGTMLHVDHESLHASQSDNDHQRPEIHLCKSLALPSITLPIAFVSAMRTRLLSLSICTVANTCFLFMTR